MEEILLQAENLSYSYEKGKQAIKDISLTVKKGEKIAVLGCNGAGKSTCFLNLNGVLCPDSGRVLYRGKEIGKRNLNELRKRVGIVFQDADNQMIASTVYAEVSFGPMNLKLPKEEVKLRVDQALSCMNLSSMKDRPPHMLSGGEKKRVSIADIIAMDSEVIIFDEPTASLDPVNVKMFQSVLDMLYKMGKTLIISTHNVDFAYGWAERVVLFSDGYIISDGPVSKVFEEHDKLKQANLKKPMLLEVFDRLIKHGILEDGIDYPRSLKDLDKLLGEKKLTITS